MWQVKWGYRNAHSRNDFNWYPGIASIVRWYSVITTAQPGNEGRLLGMFDELSAFLTKIRLYSSRGLTDSHELAMFLELYNANPWTRTTGLSISY